MRQRERERFGAVEDLEDRDDIDEDDMG